MICCVVPEGGVINSAQLTTWRWSEVTPPIAARHLIGSEPPVSLRFGGLDLSGFIRQRWEATLFFHPSALQSSLLCPSSSLPLKRRSPKQARNSPRAVEEVPMKKQRGQLGYVLSEQGGSAARRQSFDGMEAAAAEWKHPELLLRWEAVKVCWPACLRAVFRKTCLLSTCCSTNVSADRPALESQFSDANCCTRKQTSAPWW